MADELTYKNEAATGYDRAFARVTTHFAPFLLDAMRTRKSINPKTGPVSVRRTVTACLSLILPCQSGSACRSRLTKVKGAIPLSHHRSIVPIRHLNTR